MTNGARPEFKTRLSALRGDIASANWTPEGIMKLGGANIKYISLTQMKANISPLLAKHGLEFKVEMARPEPIGSPAAPSGWLERLDIEIFDVDSDESVCYTSYGYGTGDKGIQVATSFALKSMLINNFLIADGIEPIEGDGIVTPAFQPKTPKENAIAKEQIKKVSETPVTTPAPAPAPAEPAEKPAKPAISQVKRNTIKNIVDGNKAKFDAGEITKEQYDKVVAASEAVKTEAEAAKFIINNRL